MVPLNAARPVALTSRALAMTALGKQLTACRRHHQSYEPLPLARPTIQCFASTVVPMCTVNNTLENEKVSVLIAKNLMPRACRAGDKRWIVH